MTTNSIPEGCKPFDLERALAGDPVVTREGRPVTQLVKFKDANCDIYAVYGVVDDSVESWCVDGRYCANSDECEYDIFMAPKKRTVWVNLYPDEFAFWYDSEEEADGGCRHHRIGGRAYPVEIEE